MAFLSNETPISGIFKDEVSILNPVIEIEYNELPTFNYCYINALHRFYYIENINILGNKRFELELSVDVLMSYYNTLIYNIGFIDAQENRYDDDIIDENRGYEQGYYIVTYTLENDLYDLENPFLAADAHFLLVGLKVDTSSAVVEE